MVGVFPSLDLKDAILFQLGDDAAYLTFALTDT